MRTRVSAYALAIHDGHVLLTQLASFCTNGGHWTLPLVRAARAQREGLGAV